MDEGALLKLKYEKVKKRLPNGGEKYSQDLTITIETITPNCASTQKCISWANNEDLPTRTGTENKLMEVGLTT